MANTAVRFMLTVPADMATQADELKKSLFYNKPYAEMYRHLIQVGINEVKKKALNENQSKAG